MWEVKLLGLGFPVMAFIASGFEHCVANMFIIPAGITASHNPEIAQAVMTHHPTWDLSTLNTSSFIFGNLIPVTLGNIFSGAILVGAIYWYLYVKEEKREYSNIKEIKNLFNSYSKLTKNALLRTYKNIKILINNRLNPDNKF